MLENEKKVLLERVKVLENEKKILLERVKEVENALADLSVKKKELGEAVSTIFRLCSDGEIIEEATYTLPPKQALVAFVRQLQGNWETWTYPEEIPGMIRLPVSGRWAYNLPNGDMLYAK